MLDEILPPSEFTVEFLLLVVAWGSALESMRSRPHPSRWRAIAAIGFFVVGVAQFLLGLRILGPDSAIIASLIRGTGYLLILGGLGWAKTPTPVLAFMPLALLPSSAPLASAFLAYFVAVRGAMIHSRDQRPDSFSFAAAFVFLGSAEALLLLSGDGWTVTRFAAQGLGSFLLAGWLFGRFTSIRIRFVTRAIVSLVAGLLFLAAGFNVVISRTLASETRNRLADAAVARVQVFDDLGAFAVDRAATLQVGFRDSLLGLNDPQERANGIINLVEPADLLVLVNRAGTTVASAEPVIVRDGDTTNIEPRELPTVRTVPISGSPIVRESLQRRLEASRIERITYTNAQGRTISELNVLSSVPVLSEDGRRVLGALIIGYRIDAEEIGALARDTGTIAVLRVGGEVTVVRAPNGGRSELEGELRSQLNQVAGLPEANPTSSTSDITLDGRRFIVVETPVLQRGSLIGSLMLVTSPDALVGVLEGLTRVLFFLLIIALIVSSAYALRAGRRVTQPLVSLTHASQALRAGDLSARAEVTGDDEIRTLSAAFNAMAIDLEATTSDLKASVDEETALRARLEAIVQSMGDALIAIDAEARITTMNVAAERLLDAFSQDVTGQPLASVLEGTSDDGQSLAAAATTAGSGSGVLRRGRTQRLVSFESRNLTSAAGTSGRVVVIRDETETRQAERMKDEFLANVSHELRTPLTPIRGFADILTRKDIPPQKSAEYLRKILESSLRLERIVDILVDFAAIEAGRLVVRNEAVAVSGFVLDRRKEWEELEPDRVIKSRVARGVGYMHADAAVVIRALDELIDNALKFSDGPITISAELDGSARNPKVRLTVADKGSGIPEERLQDVFRGFMQVDGGETREVGGLGLGLAFVKRAIEHIGGSVDVVSDVGEGTKVSVLLPEAAKKPAKKKPVKARKAPAGSSPVKKAADG